MSRCSRPIRNVPDHLADCCGWLCESCTNRGMPDRGYSPSNTCGGMPLRVDKMRASVDLPKLTLGAAGIAEAKRRMEVESDE